MRISRIYNIAQEQLHQSSQLHHNNRHPLQRIKDHYNQIRFTPVGVTAPRITTAESESYDAHLASIGYDDVVDRVWGRGRWALRLSWS